MSRKRDDRSFIAWAIDTRSTEGHGFIGRYWSFDGLGEPPAQFAGNEVALFKTRRAARAALKDVAGRKGDGKYHAFPQAREVRVCVTIKAVEGRAEGSV
jgi:hypothetical protein